MASPPVPPPVINVLLDAAINSTVDLEAHVFGLNAIFRGDTGCKIEIIAHLRALIDLVESEGGDFVNRLDALSPAVKTQMDRLSASSDETEKALNGAASAAPAVTTAAQTMRSHAQQVVAAIASERQEARAAMQEGLEHARESAAAVLAAAEQLTKLLAERMEAARQALNHLRETVAQTRADMAAAAERLEQAAGRAEAAATAGTELYLAGIDALMNEEANDLTTFANAMVEAHNRTVVPVRRRLTEEQPEALEELVESVREATIGILTLCQERDDKLVETADACVEESDKGDSILDHIVTVVEIVLTL